MKTEILSYLLLSASCAASASVGFNNVEKNGVANIYARAAAAVSLDARIKSKGKKYFASATDQNRLRTGQSESIIQANFGGVTPENRYIYLCI